MHAKRHARALLRAAAAASSASAAAAADDPMSCEALARGFLWISSALLLLASASAALYYAWLKKTKASSNGSTRTNRQTQARLRCALLWLGCVLSGGWGVTGVVLVTSGRYRDPTQKKNALVTLATVVASACLLASAGMLIRAIFASIQAMAPGQETPPALVCLRCSCCSRVFKRALLLAPALLLAAVNFVAWNDSHQPSEAKKLSCGSSRASTFFGGATLIFLLMVLVQLLSYWLTSSNSSLLCQRRRNPPSTSAGLPSPTAGGATATSLAPESAPRISRKRQRRIVFTVLLLLSLACIAWAVLGWFWMAHVRQPPPSDSGSASQECSNVSESVVRSMSVSVVLLLLIGWSLFTLTLCCRLEDVILASSEVPKVDVSLLSPKLIRSPKGAALSPSSTGEQLRRASSTPSHSDAIV